MVRTLAKSLLVAGALGFSALVPIGSASAATACTTPVNDIIEADISDNVSPSVGCQVGTTNNDQPDPIQVNADNMFGHNDWVGVGTELAAAGNNGALTITGNTISGNFSILSSLASVYGEFMLVLKGGASDNTVPNTYVGYLLSGLSGSYLTPFMLIKPEECETKRGVTTCKNPKDEYKAISHWQLYARGEPDTGPGEVPVPAALPLLFSGLLGLGVLGRLRRRSA